MYSLDQWLKERKLKNIKHIQKSVVQIIFGIQFTNYQEALFRLHIQVLKDRRKLLCVNFAKKKYQLKRQNTCLEKAHICLSVCAPKLKGEQDQHINQIYQSVI